MAEFRDGKRTETNIMSPNVDVSCVAVEKRGHETLRSSVPLEMEVTAVLEKAGEPCKVSAAPSFISFVLQVYVLIMFCFTSMPFIFPQNAPKTRPRRTGSKMAISHSEYCHMENTSTECLPAASFFFFQQIISHL